MNYEKITLAKFSERLAEGKYNSVAGARRAIGKTEWSEADKSKAQALVNKKFGVDASAPKATKSPKAAKAPKAPKAAKKAAAKAPKAPKPAKDPKAPKGKRGRPRKNPAPDTVTLQSGTYTLSTNPESARLEEIRLTADSIRAASDGLRALSDANVKTGAAIDEVQGAVTALTAVIAHLGTLITPPGVTVEVSGDHSLNGSSVHGESSDDGLFAKQSDPV